jgi:outer membrane lipoprotein-sorting protein
VVLLLLAGCWTALAEPAATEPAATPAEPEGAVSLDADALVLRFEEIFRGSTAQMKAAMTIQRPRWTRTVTFRSWDDRSKDRSLVRILGPAKDRGTGFLREDQTLWTYLPRIERTTRIPPSMMLQPWMGSDFSNDDLVRESSIVEDYTARDLGYDELDGLRVRGIELIPREEAPVVWSRIEIWIEAERVVPVRELFFDEPEPGRFEAVRDMRFSEVREVQGRPLPHLWVATPLDKEGHTTRVEVMEMLFDEPLDDSLFTLANLKRAEAVR